MLAKRLRYRFHDMACCCVAVLTLGLAPTLASADPIANVIEIDGNNVDDSGAGFPIDWCDLVADPA